MGQEGFGGFHHFMVDVFGEVAGVLQAVKQRDGVLCFGLRNNAVNIKFTIKDRAFGRSLHAANNFFGNTGVAI